MKIKEIITNILFTISVMVSLWCIIWVGAIAQGNA
jgi:hypothetical protein